MKIIVNQHQEYRCLTLSDGYKLEQFGAYRIARPEVTASNNKECAQSLKEKSDFYYEGKPGKGQWIKKHDPSDWIFNYRDLTFKLEVNRFNQVGIFPEQAYNWDYVYNKIKDSKRDDIKVLNLFAYTGAATINASKAGADEVVHVDALKSVNDLAQENSHLSGTDQNFIRYFQDDVIKFLKREIRRKNSYDIIIMDPPSFGRGPKGEIWKFNQQIQELFKLAAQLISDNPLCVVVSTYNNDYDQNDLKRDLKKHFSGTIKTGRLQLPVFKQEQSLDCGVFGHVDL